MREEAGGGKGGSRSIIKIITKLQEWGLFGKKYCCLEWSNWGRMMQSVMGIINHVYNVLIRQVIDYASQVYASLPVSKGLEMCLFK